MSDDLFKILKECFGDVAYIGLNDDNMIAVKFKKKYIKNKNRKSIDEEVDKLTESVFVNYEEKGYSAYVLPVENYQSQNNGFSNKSGNGKSNGKSDIVDRSYNHNDPNSKIIIFDTKPDAMLHQHRYVVVKFPDVDRALPDVTINTREYSKNTNGSIKFKPILTVTHKQKYLAFVTGVFNILYGYNRSNGVNGHENVNKEITDKFI